LVSHDDSLSRCVEFSLHVQLPSVSFERGSRSLRGMETTALKRRVRDA
jgi:hypothetical protein